MVSHISVPKLVYSQSSVLHVAQTQGKGTSLQVKQLMSPRDLRLGQKLVKPLQKHALNLAMPAPNSDQIDLTVLQLFFSLTLLPSK